MKYTVEREINLARDKVVELLTTPENRRHWQTGFQSHQVIEGEKGEEGTKSLLKFRFGQQIHQLLETLHHVDLPDTYVVSYVSSNSANLSRNTFYALGTNRTRWVVDLELKLSGMFNITAMLKPQMFKDQTDRLMNDFVNYAEKSGY